MYHRTMFHTQFKMQENESEHDREGTYILEKRDID